MSSVQLADVGPPPTETVDAPPRPPPPVPYDAPSTGLMFGEVIERALKNELRRRSRLLPHQQLALEANASFSEIEEAAVRQRSYYEPTPFAIYGKEVQLLAGEVLAIVETAYQQLLGEAHLRLQRKT